MAAGLRLADHLYTQYPIDLVDYFAILKIQELGCLFVRHCRNMQNSYKRILVAIDGSETSHRALHEAIRLAKDQQGHAAHIRGRVSKP